MHCAPTGSQGGPMRNVPAQTWFLTALIVLGSTAADMRTAQAACNRAGMAPLRASSISTLVQQALDLGPAPSTERHGVVVSLDPRNRAALESFLVDVQNPLSPRFQQFLSQSQFNSLYGPTD